MVDRRVGDGNVDAVDVEDGARFDQLVEQRDLFGGQFLGEKIGDGIEVGAMFEEEGGGPQVADGGRIEAQAAGVLVEAEHHQRRLVGGRFDVAFAEDLAEDCDRGPDRFDDLERAAQVGMAGRMVVVDVHRHPLAAGDGAKGTDAVELAHVDQDQPFDGVEVDVLDAFETVGVNGAAEEELAQAFFLGAGKDQFGTRVEPPRGNHRPQAVEIGVDVGGNDVHRV